MVASGLTMISLSLAAGFLWWKRRRIPDSKWFLRGIVAAGPLGFIAIEAGWMVTELGRQPWIIYNVMRTEEAVTLMPGIAVPFAVFTVIYLFLSVILLHLLRREFMKEPEPTPDPSTA